MTYLAYVDYERLFLFLNYVFRCGSAAELYAYCPFKITEDATSVTIKVTAFFYNNIYTIDKTSGDVNYDKSLEGQGRTTMN